MVQSGPECANSIQNVLLPNLAFSTIPGIILSKKWAQKCRIGQMSSLGSLMLKENTLYALNLGVLAFLGYGYMAETKETAYISHSDRDKSLFIPQ